MIVNLNVIAQIKSDFPTKFGLPRQSGIVEELKSFIVFKKEYSVPEAFRGLEGFSHIWIVWGFSGSVCDKWSPTVRPPRLGGNTRMGVFATRSPFRPNPIGLSCVKLCGIRHINGITVIEVSGADMMDGTPVYDIKPYLPYTDSREDASGGFAEALRGDRLDVVFPPQLNDQLPADKRKALEKILRSDPRPSYQNEPDRIYGFGYSGFEIKFKVSKGILTVCDIEKIKESRD